ncbi:MAG: T9SS type A sorting domain-containing protein [Bacteroidia bacterium]|nr:T9SS type A sorting domain-containing protein [Bacteroidia bacterium]
MEKLASEDYYKNLLADPATGKVPKNIRYLELAYAASIPVNSDSKREDIWKARGPNNLGGRTRAFGIDVIDHNVVLAGSATGGIFKSLNGGLNWFKTKCPVNAITCLIQDKRPNKSHIWYAGTGELSGSSGSAGGAYYYGEGILKSTDNGETWTQIAYTVGVSPTSFDSDFDGVWNIAIDNSNLAQDELYAAVYSGIYKSTDGGITWKKKRHGALGSYSYYTDVALSSDGTVYVTMSNESTHRGIWRSPDGETWTAITPTGFPSVYGRIAIGIAPSDEKQVWFMAAVTTNFGFVSTNFQGVKEWNSLWKYDYISGDGAGSNGRWVNRSANLPDKGGDFGYFSTQGGYDLFIRVHPNDTNSVFIGATNLWRSSNAFKDSTKTAWIGGYAVNTTRPDFKMYPNHHPDQHNLVFLPNNANKAYSTHDGGISLTNDILATDVDWSAQNNNYITSQFYTVAIDHATNLSQLVIGGLQDNGTHFANLYGMASWHMSLSSDGSFCAVKNGGSEIYASTQLGRIMHLEVDAIGRPLKYARIDPFPLNRNNYDFINPFALDPNNQKILYIPAKTRLFRNTNIESKPLSTNYDSTRWDTPLWEELTNCTTPANHEVSAITVSKSNPNTLYYATDKGKLFKVNNANIGQPKPIDITGSNFSNGNIVCVNTDPIDSNRLSVVFSNYNVISLFYSLNGGISWTNISGNLEQNVNGSGNGPSCRWAAVMPLMNGKRTWFVGTSVGLFATDSLAGINTVWIKQSPNGIGNNIVTMIDTRPEDFYLAVSTHGNGVFSANIASAWQITSNKPIEKAQFAIYPNPITQNRFILNSSISTARLNFEVVDVNGRIITNAIKNTNSLNDTEIELQLNPLPSGMYFLFIDNGHEKSVKRLLIQDL